MKEVIKGKTPWSYLPADALNGVADAFAHGATKHGDKAYLNTPDGERLYFDALIRHLYAWYYTGKSIDADSGLHHLDLAGANMVILIDRVKKGVDK